MSTFDLISEIRKLPVSDQMLVIERTMHSIRVAETQKRMRHAADLLYDDYATDPELTTFTELDTQDFYESA